MSTEELHAEVKVSELIVALQAFASVHGDLSVYVRGYEGGVCDANVLHLVGVKRAGNDWSGEHGIFGPHDDSYRVNPEEGYLPALIIERNDYTG